MGRLLNIQLCRGCVLVVRGAEIGGGGCFFDSGKARFRSCFGRRPAQTASWITAWMRDFAATRDPKCAAAAMSRALFYPIPDWLTLRVAYVRLSSVKPGKRRFRERCPTEEALSIRPMNVRELQLCPVSENNQRRRNEWDRLQFLCRLFGKGHAQSTSTKGGLHLSSTM